MGNQYIDRVQSSPEHLAERRLFILECRKRALTWEQVALEVRRHFQYSISAVQARADFGILMRERNAELREEIDETRNIMLEQLDQVLRTHLHLATDGGGSTDSAEIVIKILTRKARLIGADAPTKTEVEDRRERKNLNKSELLERIALLSSRIQGHLGPAPTVVDVTPVPRKDEPAQLSEAHALTAVSLDGPSDGEEGVDDSS